MLKFMYILDYSSGTLHKVNVEGCYEEDYEFILEKLGFRIKDIHYMVSDINYEIEEMAL